MKKISILATILTILAIFFYALSIISENNTCTSVRKYLCTKQQQLQNTGSQRVSTNSGISENNIILTSPFNNEKISSPVNLIGKARVFENTFNYRIIDSNGKILKEGYGNTDATDTGLFGNFSIKVYFTNPTTSTGSIEIFEYSPKDGSEVNKVTAPVIFLK